MLEQHVRLNSPAPLVMLMDDSAQVHCESFLDKQKVYFGANTTRAAGMSGATSCGKLLAVSLERGPPYGNALTPPSALAAPRGAACVYHLSKHALPAYLLSLSTLLLPDSVVY